MAEELSKSAKRRQRAKANAAAAPEEEPPAPAAPKAKAKSQPQPAPPAQQAQPKAKAKPESKPQEQAKPKAKAAAKGGYTAPAPPAEEPRKSTADFIEFDDGTGGDWEVSTGISKKAQKNKDRKDAEQAEIQKLKAAGYGTTKSGTIQQQHIPGMAPVSAVVASTKAAPAASQSVTAAPEKIAEKKEESSMATVRVPEAKLGRVIGPKGANIKLITEKTGCTRIDTTGDVVTITGPPASVGQAEHAIKELIEKGYMSMAFENFATIPIMVHPSCFPDLIGKQGVVIQAIKKELGVEVEIPPVPKSTPPGKKYAVNIAGNCDKVQHAKKVVEDLVMYGHSEVTHPGVVHEELEVAPWQYSFIIGKAGSELRHVQNNYKVKMNIPREHSANQNVLIVGERVDVDRAKAYVEKVLWNAENASKGRDREDKAIDDGRGDDGEHEPWMDAYMYKRR